MRSRVLPATVIVPDSVVKPGAANCSLEMVSPLPSALVSAMTLPMIELPVPPYSAMPLARFGCSTVL